MGYRANNIIARAEGLETKGVKIFAPILNDEELEEIQEIFEGLEARGWFLKHWAVTAYQNNSETGYPVFRHEG